MGKKKNKSQASEQAQSQSTTTSEPTTSSTSSSKKTQTQAPTPSPTPPPTAATSNGARNSSAAPNPWFGSKSKNGEPSTSALIICRNKCVHSSLPPTIALAHSIRYTTNNTINRHWRYISSFHGPWLQLPPEVLESLAHTNYISPRPHPIDPAVFYDLVKIRKAVDEATNIAVRAASGVTSASLNASLSANNGMLNGAGAAALGLGFGGTGGGAKLSRERKHRMRELATQKLSAAYHLDEIAASVATMQSASTLEDLAMHVLQRNALDYDARYVHFFHEKIPSRMMAEYTPLDPLDRLLEENRSDGPAFRTRALTRIFKEDYAEAARDLSEGLAIAKYELAKHRQGRDQLVLASEAAKQQQQTRNGSKEWRNEVSIPEEDQPSSLEAQLLFHRGNVHLALSCQHVHDALDAYWDEQDAKDQSRQTESAAHRETPPEEMQKSQAERTAHKKHLDYRKMVKSNAKKALRDYLEFLKHFDYTPGIPAELAEEFIRRINAATQTESKTRTKNVNGTKITTSKMTLDFDISPSEDPSTSPLDAETGALIPAAKKTSSINPSDLPQGIWPPPPEIYPASTLFSEKIPASIPPYPPPTSNALATRSGPTPSQLNSSPAAAAALQDTHESITYHPLLTDALHSLLLCHALLQTSPTELRRHAHNAARLARICDGYPVFLAARSPARADWVEVLRRGYNWVGLTETWEELCRPSPVGGHGTGGVGDRGWSLAQRSSDSDAHAKSSSQSQSQSKSSGSEVEKLKKKPGTPTAGNTAEEKNKEMKERRKHEAILEALADERVVDEESFQRAVRARERRAVEDEEMAEKARRDESQTQTQTLTLEDKEPVRTIEDGSAPAPAESAAAPEPAISSAAPKVNGNTASEPTPPPSTATTPNGTSASKSSPRKPSTSTNGTFSSNNPRENQTPKRWAQDESKDYPISTERAEAISRWVREAPLTVEGAGKGKKKKASGAARKKGAISGSVERGMEGLKVGDGEGRVEEEIDE